MTYSTSLSPDEYIAWPAKTYSASPLRTLLPASTTSTELAKAA